MKLNIIGLCSILSTTSFAYDTMYFQVSHVKANDALQTPIKGTAALSFKLSQEPNWLHEARSEHPIFLDQMEQEHVRGTLLSPDVTGDYTIFATCTGSGPLAGQTTESETLFTLNSGIREVDIAFACPVSESGRLMTPQKISVIPKPR
jgi:hypothetical protein